MWIASSMVMQLQAAAAAAGVRAEPPAGSDGALLKMLSFGGGPMYAADLQRAVETFGPVLTGCYGMGALDRLISVTSDQPALSVPSSIPELCQIIIYGISSSAALTLMSRDLRAPSQEKVR